MYGQKEAPREWYHKFCLFMLSQGYRQSDIDHCLYTKRAKEKLLYLSQIEYIEKVLKCFNMEGEKVLSTPLPPKKTPRL